MYVFVIVFVATILLAFFILLQKWNKKSLAGILQQGFFISFLEAIIAFQFDSYLLSFR